MALLLLDKGASPHAAAKNGYTPLHITAKKNQLDIARHLLDYQARTDAESKAGYTPLHLAAQEGHVDMTNLLLRYGADLNAKAKNGLAPVHLCAQEDRVSVAAILASNGADLDAETRAGYTPLHVASHFGSLAMVRFLLEQVTFNLLIGKHSTWQTFLFLKFPGRPRGREERARLHPPPPGRAAGALPDRQPPPGEQRVAQHRLKRERNYFPPFVSHLAECSPPPALKQNGQTPLSIAQRLGYISVVETLKVVTEQEVKTTTTTTVEEKYRCVPHYFSLCK